MAKKFAQGKFPLKNPDKYIGNTLPMYRSSWEYAVMQMCDSKPSIKQWASESIKIPYIDPFTGKHTIYVPDFFVNFVDKNGQDHVELWEVKPKCQLTVESAGRSKRNQAQAIKNAAKWKVAKIWCEHRNIKFRILTEDDLFHVGKSK